MAPPAPTNSHRSPRIASSTQRATVYEAFRHTEELGRQAANSTEPLPRRIRQPTQQQGHNYLCALQAAFAHESRVHSLVTVQMNANQGVKLFGASGKAAIEKELHQLLDRRVLHGVSHDNLTLDQRHAALQYLMFLKEKRSGVIKGCGCADGRKQRLYKSKEETSSPTVSIEALLLTCLIDAMEDRAVMVCDIPGAFMQADIDEIIHVKMDGAILEVLLQMDPSYHQFVATERGKNVLYTQLDKALYGTLQASLLF